jgi:hypothetical protein
MTARAAAQYLNLKVLDDFAVGSPRQSESLRAHWRAAPYLSFFRMRIWTPRVTQKKPW